MKITTNYEPLFRRNVVAFDAAVADTLADAKHRARVKTGVFQRSIQSKRTEGNGIKLEAVIGSDLVSARAHEKGAYIQAKKHDTLFIAMPDGSVRRPTAVRIGATPAVVPAGAQFPKFMTARLREGASR